MINNILIEICIGNVEDALKADRYPIDRIELNSALELGGLSSSVETLKFLKERIKASICCMVRPRGGDFLYSENEYQLMLKDAENFLKNKADGIVFGFLKEDQTIDQARTKKMIELIHSYDKEAIFHKAFDETPDLSAAAETLNELKIDRILTSGAAVYPDILEGCKKISELHDRYPRIQFLPGGGVRVHNISQVISTANSRQIHMSAKKENPGHYLELDEQQLAAMLKEIGKQ